MYNLFFCKIAGERVRLKKVLCVSCVGFLKIKIYTPTNPFVCLCVVSLEIKLNRKNEFKMLEKMHLILKSKEIHSDFTHPMMMSR